MTRHRPLRCRAALLGALALSTTLAGMPAVALAGPTMDPAGLVAVARLDRDAVARLYAQAVLADAVPALEARLDVLARAATSPERRAMALMVRACVAWQAGDAGAARRAAADAVAAAPGPDALALDAELRDATAQGGVAEAYRRARAAATDPVARARIDLRLALIAGVRRPDALVAFAQARPPAEARRLAPVLALLGRPRAALDLMPAGAEATAAAQLRWAEWAIAAGDTATARDRAWRAFGAARDAADRRYALALLVEAYRNAGDLAGAAAFLAAQPANPDIAQTRVDLLLESGRTDQAIALIERSTDPALRARLMGVLDLGNRPDAREAEYRRLIAADPHQPQWYGALAQSHLARGDEAAALAVYRALFAANVGRTDVEIAAARQMIAMGLHEQAIAMIADGRGGAAASATHLFLFETYLDRGERDKARGELEMLRRGPGAAALATDIADGYDRLGLPEEAIAVLPSGMGAASYDTQLRLAELEEKAKRPADALRRWRALWGATTLPARRSYAERQIVRLAAQTGGLASLADTLDARLSAGTAAAGEIDLLVALRLEQKKPDLAVAAVRRAAQRGGQDEVTLQRRLARLYTQLRDHDALVPTLHRLIAIDPDMRADYQRQLIVETVRVGGSGEELDRAIADMDGARGADAYRFKAAVYTIAAADEKAIVQLRAGIAAKPGDADALLQFVGALKKARRTDEAIAILQYVAETGDAARFATAIDGLLDMVSDASVDDRAATAALSWAERRVLERIATAGQDARLLGLLADIGDAGADDDLQYRALEASLPMAGEQRASVLRQLMTLAKGGGGAGAAPAPGDPRRHVVYVRRLLSLGKSYPPDVYAEMARTLLAAGDDAGAARAFAMMGDLGGLVNVDEVRGDAYAAQDNADAALANYARALLRDQGNLDLVVKTSILREREGEDALAQRWYWRGLRGLIARQSTRLIGQDGDDQAVEARRYLPTLVEGLLLTWPSDPAAGQAIVADVRRMFDAAIADVGPTAAGSFGGYRRLAMIVELGQRIADARGDATVVDGWEAVLDRTFPADADRRRAAALHRDLAGRAAPAAGADWPLAGLGTQAIDSDNATLALALAAAAGDGAAVRAIAAAALADEVAWREAVARGEQPAGRPPTYLALLVQMLAMLPPDRFRDAVVGPFLASPQHEVMLFDLFRGSPEAFYRVQDLAGARLLSTDALISAIIERDGSPLALSARLIPQRGAPDAWMRDFSTDQLLTLYDALVTNETRGAPGNLRGDTLVPRLLATPLDATRRARLSAIMMRDVAHARDPRAPSVAPLLKRLSPATVDPGNRALLLAVAEAAAQRYPDAARLPATVGSPQTTTDGPGSVAADERQREIDAFMADPHPDAERIAAFNDRFVIGDDAATTEQRQARLEKLVAVAPDQPSYRDALLAIYASQGAWEGYARVLRGRMAARADDPELATMLALAERLQGLEEAARATAAAADIAVDDPDWLLRLARRAERARGGPLTTFGPLFDAYRARFADLPAVAAVAARRGTPPPGQDAPAPEPMMQRLVAADRRDPASVRGMLRYLWRTGLPIAGEQLDDQNRIAFGRALAAGPAALTLRPEVTAELERYLRVATLTTQPALLPVYEVVARGTIAQGQADTRTGALLERLRSDRLDTHETRLLAVLADRMAATTPPVVVPPTPDDTAHLVARLRATPAMTVQERVLMARVLARAGAPDAAAGLLRAALLQMLYGATPLDFVDDQAAMAQQIVGVLRTWPDRQAAAAIHAGLSAVLADSKTKGISFTRLDALPPPDDGAIGSPGGRPTTTGG